MNDALQCMRSFLHRISEFIIYKQCKKLVHLHKILAWKAAHLKKAKCKFEKKTPQTIYTEA